ncbi:MAG: hypothetical protein E7317_03750 [Clostridiales bacterium]|nr:hypothetical protein [Clostridiales bacterium]
MRRAAALLLVLLACFSAAAEGGFSFQGALTWQSGPEDALAWMGEGATIEEDAQQDYGTVETVVCDDLAFNGLRCARMSATFLDGAPAGLFCYFRNEDLGDPFALLDAVAKDYGEPTRYGAPDYYGSASAFATFCTWDYDADTSIAIYTYTQSGARYPYDHCVAFEHTPVMQKLVERMDSYSAADIE